MPKQAEPRWLPESQRALCFQRLAEAVGGWQLVEMQLFRIYAWLARCENAAVSSAAFRSIINFRARLTMVDAAAAVALADDTLKARWEDLHKRIKGLSKRRNVLVHFVVVYGFNKPASESGPYLQPNIYDIRAQPHRLDHSKIAALAVSFEAPSRETAEFVNSLPARSPSPGI
jgi:hypothetical protein